MNSLSSQIIDLPPLELSELRRSIKESLSVHCGETLCVASVVNGGGKTHYIQSQVSRRQKCSTAAELLYRKVPVRESTDANKLITLLSSVSRRCGSSSVDNQFAYHLDIGHVIPEVSNTILFELLYVGVARDPKTCRCHYRNPADVFYVEVPNSPNNKTAEALRFCCLLPTVVLHVTADTLDFNKPVFSDQLGMQIVTPEYSELIFVCKWLRALSTNKLKHGDDSYDPDYSPYMDTEISAEECFTSLCSSCISENGGSVLPSWSIFHSFVVFMNMQFTALQEYPLTQGGILASIEGLENFKEVFVKLLVETSKDFSLRSVPQLKVVGPPPSSEYAIANELNKNELDRKDVTSTAISVSDGLPPLPPSMKREKSAELTQAEFSASRLEPPSSIRQSSEEIAARFKNMMSWEQSEHPIVAFKMDDRGGGGISGVDIISLNRSYLSRHMPQDLIESLEANKFEFNRDWASIKNEEGAEILRNVDGLSFMHRGGVRSLEPGYVMTVDNMLKMLSIQLRLRYNLPAIIMGETGCGKSTLIRNMCSILGLPLHTLNVHGGMEDHDIIQWMNSKISLAQELNNDTSTRIVLFLDEINTCNCMGLFKEIVCDRSLNGFLLPENIKIIAACNPYRLRNTKSLYGGEEMAGLIFEHFSGSAHGGHRVENVGTGIKDPLRNLVYRVHPLPESMIDHIFDFGALSSETERLYIQAMLKEQLSIYNESAGDSGSEVVENGIQPTFFGIPRTINMFNEFIDVFTELVCTAQECVRHLAEGERSVTSLRDVSRCVKIFLWFAQHFADTRGVEERWNIIQFFSMKGALVQKYVRKCVILSLSYCYHARLPRNERSVLVNALSASWRRLQTANYYAANPLNFGYAAPGGGLGYTRPKCPWLKLEMNTFVSNLEETQREFVSVMNLGDGIALNEALCENLFMILCSILNKIPIFVIGKPGSSKSLAMGLIQSNLNGDASEGTFLKSLPAVEVFSYQCSPLSTSGGIEQVFDSSRRYLRQASNTVVVVLLDEVGLAEQSPHLPLKVLHKLLDEMLNGEAVVGISNWSLDPAKMNRAVHLYRPAPTIEDLSLTAEGMVRSANLKGYLQSLAQAYDETYKKQEHSDFWGLREFYSTVRAINSNLVQKRLKSESEIVSLDGPTLMNAILRNFGGRPHEMQKIVYCFFSKLGLPLPGGWEDTLIEKLIADNLREPEARHLMLLTKSNAALSLLFDRRILKKDRTEIIFGSDFLLDKTDLYIYLQLQRIKHCMAEGITVVLVHCEALYESLYDLLNQHYVEYGGQIYVRIAFGTYTKLCPIHRGFRVVVIVEKREAYTRLAPPLLNRFEKQVFERKNVLRSWHLGIVQKVQNFVSLYCCKDLSAFKSLNSTDSLNNISLKTLRFAFCGYHTDFLSSLLLAAEDYVLSKLENESKKHGLTEFRWRDIESFCADNDEDASLQEKLTDRVFAECIDRLLWVSPPEAVFRIQSVSDGNLHKYIQKSYSVDVLSKYFGRQRHSSLASFVSKVLFRGQAASDKNNSNLDLPDNEAEVYIGSSRHSEYESIPSGDINEWRDELGCQVVAMTYAPWGAQEAKAAVEAVSPLTGSITSIVLHELDQERELRQIVVDYFKSAQSGSVLLVQCDPVAASKRRIEHAKFIIELARAKRYKQIIEEKVCLSNDRLLADELKINGAEEKIEEDPSLIDTHQSFQESKESTEKEALSHGVHVVLLVHLARGDESGADSRFCVDFDTRWNYAFVDSLTTASGLPDIESMIGKSAVEIFELFDPKKLLSSSFRSALSRLNYFYERTSEDVKNQIICVLKCLEKKEFVELVIKIIKVLIPEYTGEASKGIENDEISWLTYNINNLADRELQLAGTFQSALHSKILDIVSTLLAVTISHAMRNDTLSILMDETIGASDFNCETWIYLFQMSFHGSSTICFLKQKLEGGKRIQKGGISHNAISRTSRIIDVKGDDMEGEVLKSKFPFSFYLVPVVDSMRNVCELLDESHLVRQFATTGIGMNLTAKLDTHTLSCYAHDLMCMRCRSVSGIPRSAQAVLFEHILSIYSEESSSNEATLSNLNVSESKEEKNLDVSTPLSENLESRILQYIAQIHWRYWRVERFISLYFDLLHANPSSAKEVYSFVMGCKSLDMQSYFGILMLVLRLLKPNVQKWADIKSNKILELYRSWLSMLPSVKRGICSILDLVHLDSQHEDIVKNEWNKIELFGRFVQDVSMPLEMNPARTVTYFDRFGEDLILVSPKGLNILVTLLSSINRELGLGQQVSEDLICPITNMRFVNPVIAADGFTYEMEAITNWMQKAMRSPMTNEPLLNTTLKPNKNLVRRLEVVDTCDLNRVLDYYIFELALSSGRTEDKLSTELIDDLLKLSSGSYFSGRIETHGSVCKESDCVSLSYSGILCLVRELLKMSSLSRPKYGFFSGGLGPITEFIDDFGLVTQVVESCVTKELENSFNRTMNLDNMFSSVYLSVKDGLFLPSRQTYDALIADSNGRESIILSTLKSLDKAEIEACTTARTALDTIVYLRSLIHLTADVICGHDFSLNQCQVDKLLEITNDHLSSCGVYGSLMNSKFLYRSRLYFLKCLERKRGVSFLRNALMSHPLRDAPWVIEWKQSGETGFLRFIGHNKLPKWNPFVHFPLFTEVQGVISAFVSSKNVEDLSCSITELIGDNSLRRVFAAFILAGFHEVGMLKLLPPTEFSALNSIIDVLRGWIRSSDILNSFSIVEKEIIEFFVVGVPYLSQDSFVSLSDKSSAQDIIMYRILVHLVAICFAASSEHPFYFLRQLFIAPATLGESYFPTMPEDLTKMAQEAMGGRWYACPNGHPFYVDQCGRPTEVNTCVECGVQIGGEDHDLLSSNVDLGGVGTGYFKKSVLEDKSEKKYCIGSVQQEKEESKGLTARELAPSGIRIIRLFMHTALCFGGCLQKNLNWARDVMNIFNSSYLRPQEGVSQFFKEHLIFDWETLMTTMTLSIDDISVILHGILLKAMHVDFVEFWRTDPPNELIEYTDLNVSQKRSQWERRVGIVFVGSIVQNTDMKKMVAEIYGLCCGEDDDNNGSFACDLLEKVSVDALPLEDRKYSLPRLWLRTRHFSLEHFTMSLNMQQNAAERFPALTKFLQEEPQLRALRYMPQMFEWFRVLHKKCSGHLDRETARKKTVGDLFSELEEAERFNYNKVFVGFTAAWNESWQYVQKYGCIRFPVDFNKVVMGESTALSFSLPNEQDEGNCPLALAHYLTDKHNSFVQVADESRLMRDKRSLAENGNSVGRSRVEVISSHFFSNAHTILYDLNEELVPLLEKSCVTWSVDGTGYDFHKAEVLVVDRVLSGLPAIDFEQRGFQYMFEQHLQGGLSYLRSKLKQVPLSKDALESIRRDIGTPAAANKTLGLLETVISFLTATGGSIVASLDSKLSNMLLSEYASTVLMMDEILGRSISQLVQLRHLESLWDALTEMTNCDMFSKVHTAYRAPLTERLVILVSISVYVLTLIYSNRSTDLLLACLKSSVFDADTLLPVMKAFIMDHLQDKVIDAKISVSLCLGDCEVGDVYLSDTSWFIDCFPDTLIMAEIVEGYNFLSRGGVNE